MQADLEELRITQKELENLSGLEVSEVFMGGAWRPSIIRNPKRLLSFLMTEVFTFGLILIFCLPIGLIVARSFGGLTGDASSAAQFLQVSFGVSVAIAFLWNLYMWQKGKSLKLLAHLLDEVDKHNEIIAAVDVIDELGAIKNSTISLIDRGEVLAALTATRESLVCALMTEKILRKHKRFIARRHELFSNIETSLVTLQHLRVTSQADEYGQLLNEALQIGMSVHQEMKQDI
ncbi:MAG: hypothetical protein HC833_22290 [Leptolyngbyaceae cyanobacterium RM1_406_9]|nr:hypothetical protein [Leptolyngbyaceae cyanobacterium RM1_406_9]